MQQLLCHKNDSETTDISLRRTRLSVLGGKKLLLLLVFGIVLKAASDNMTIQLGVHNNKEFIRRLYSSS